jgi:cold-shock-like DNA binding protein
LPGGLLLRAQHGRFGGSTHLGILGDGYRSLAEGAQVSYEEEQGDKGPKAVNVTKL